MKPYLLAPSLLSANFARLGEEAEAVLQAGGDLLHLDVMDNHYVPNLTLGPLVCESLRKFGITAPMDVHLMARPVDRLITDFAKAGANSITIHAEGSDHLDRSIDLIHQQGCQAGLAFNPASTLHCLEYLINKIDLILIMSVNPGFGGQTFIPSALEKIKHARSWIDKSGRDIRLSVDGGIKVDNIRQVAEAGADMFVAGSAIFNHPPYAKTLQALRDALPRKI